MIELDMRDSPAQLRNLDLPSHLTESSPGGSDRHGSHVANRCIGKIYRKRNEVSSILCEPTRFSRLTM